MSASIIPQEAAGSCPGRGVRNSCPERQPGPQGFVDEVGQGRHGRLCRLLTAQVCLVKVKVEVGCKSCTEVSTRAVDNCAEECRVGWQWPCEVPETWGWRAAVLPGFTFNSFSPSSKIGNLSLTCGSGGLSGHVLGTVAMTGRAPAILPTSAWTSTGRAECRDGRIGRASPAPGPHQVQGGQPGPQVGTELCQLWGPFLGVATSALLLQCHGWAKSPCTVVRVVHCTR